jgi:hypothetical protein
MDNVVADALSRRHALLTQLDAKIFGLESIKDLYATNSYFVEPFSKCCAGMGWEKFHLHERFLFRANKLCIPDCSVRPSLLQEAYAGGLMGHFGSKKTEQVLADHFFWPNMRRDVERYVLRYETCHKAKSRLNPYGLYILVYHGKTFLWILFSVYLELRGGEIQSLLWLIAFVKWLILFPVIRVTMLHTLLNYFSGTLCAYMVCHELLCLIVTPNI